MTFWCSCYWWNDFTILNITWNNDFRIFHKIYLIVEKSNYWSYKKWIWSGLLNGPFLFIEKLIKPITNLSPRSHVSYRLKLTLYMKNISFNFSESLNFMILRPSILSLSIHSSIPGYIWMTILPLSFFIEKAWNRKLFSCHFQYFFIIRLVL